MPLLQSEEIHTIHDAVIAAQLDPDDLLSALAPAFRSQIPTARNPSAQLVRALDFMNETGVLADGTVPLKIWLDRAAYLARELPESHIFRDAAARCGATSIIRGPRFQEIPPGEWGESQTYAEKLMVGKMVPMPSREILFAPEGIGSNLLPRGEIAGLIDACEIRTSRGQRMFPPIYDNNLPPPFISQQGLVWQWEALNHGYYGHFAVGRDGSFMLRELVRESLPGGIRPPLAPGVGLFTCIDRLVGALLFARRLATRYTHVKQAKLRISLAGIEGRTLAFDFEGEGYYNIWLSAPKVATSNEALAHVRLSALLDDTDTEALAAKFGEDLTSFFGWKWNPNVVDAEIHNILLSASNRAPLT